MAEETVSGSLQKLFVSGVRLQAGVALFGLEQLQHLLTAKGADREPAAIVAHFARALNTLSDTLSGSVDDTKKDALRSVSRVAERAAAKSAEVVSRMAGRGTEEAETPALSMAPAAGSSAAPVLAVDVLMGPPYNEPAP
jgi:hypothetical protein